MLALIVAIDESAIVLALEPRNCSIEQWLKGDESKYREWKFEREGGNWCMLQVWVKAEEDGSDRREKQMGQ